MVTNILFVHCTENYINIQTSFGKTKKSVVLQKNLKKLQMSH